MSMNPLRVVARFPRPVRVLLLGTLNNGIVLLGINSSWQVAVNGLVILIAVFLDARRRRATGQD